ncbi:MAG: hypothetical protein R3C60_11510 [Parvularculaceae bacterium]
MTRTLNSPAAVRAAVSAPPSRKASRRNTASGGTLIFGVLISAALVWGYAAKGGAYSSEHGLGYWLGIVGGVLMLALLLYPLRKHAPFMRGAGPVSYWFRMHMALGLIGPTLILYHAHFGLDRSTAMLRFSLC